MMFYSDVVTMYKAKQFSFHVQSKAELVAEVTGENQIMFALYQREGTDGKEDPTKLFPTKHDLVNTGGHSYLLSATLEPGLHYVLKLKNSQHPAVAEITYALRVEITQHSLDESLFSSIKELPQSVDEIRRQKMRSTGVKEAAFLKGSKQMIKLMDENRLRPFAQSNKVYSVPHQS